MTEADLAEIDAAILAFNDKFTATIAKHMPSNGNTIKIHKQKHAVHCLELTGNLSNVHAQFMEAKHHELKVRYNATNKQSSFMQQMVSKGRLQDIAEQASAAISMPAQQRRYNTAFARTAAGGGGTHHGTGWGQGQVGSDGTGSWCTAGGIGGQCGTRHLASAVVAANLHQGVLPGPTSAPGCDSCEHSNSGLTRECS
jgi:hypothetical protein